MTASGHERRALVTGGAGFIGSHVVDAFLADRYEVVAVDDLSKGVPENLARDARLEVFDIIDAARLDAVVSDFDPHVICHLAAQSSVTVSVSDPARDLDVNVRGTFNVLEAARRVRAPVVFASTGGALYGNGAPLPTNESHPPEPLAPYGASKLAGEAYVATWARLFDLPNVILRLGNVYGPRQSTHGEAGVVAIFSDRLLRGETPTVYGDGLQTRDYVHVADVASAFKAASERAKEGTFNIGTGIETSVLTLLEHLQDAAKTRLEPAFEPLREGELLRSALDSDQAVVALGLGAAIPVDAGLAETFRWYAAR
jgi:UDP-glucose 4-epimerase